MTTKPDEALVARIDALLPQTQCTRCGYQGCKPYATALATGEAELNRCPPGGESGIGRLAVLLGRPALPLDPACGDEAPPRVAEIVEEDCIGCARCIDACPVDAIVGARRYMHTVIAAECSGCDLCLPVCPVDCIVMVPDRRVPDRPLTRAEIDARAAQYRDRIAARAARRERERHAWQQALDEQLHDSPLG
jgi:Na+-translocating ferredoxin:NAD+ oxidoreductase subunit B